MVINFCSGLLGRIVSVSVSLLVPSLGVSQHVQSFFEMKLDQGVDIFYRWV